MNGGIGPGNLHFFSRETVAKVEFCPAKGRTRTGSYKHLEVWASEFPWRTQVGGNNSCNHALTKAREAHWQALEAAHILEEKIEWLSQSATRMRSTGCQHYHSCAHLRRQSRGCLRGHTKTPTGGHHAKVPLAISSQEDPRGRHLQSSSPTQWRQQVTFQDQKGESSSEEDSLGEHMGQASSRGEPAECDLGPLPTLKPELGVFLGGWHPCKMWKGVVTCHWSPLWKIKRCGWSGKPTMLTCWSGGRN